MLARSIGHWGCNDAGGEAIEVSPCRTGHTDVHAVAMIEALVGGTRDRWVRRHHHPRKALKGAVKAHVGIAVHGVRGWLPPVLVGMLAIEARRAELSHGWCHAVVVMVRGRRVAVVGVVSVRHAIGVAVGRRHLAVAIAAVPMHQRHVSAVVRKLRRRRRGWDTVPSGTLIVVASAERGGHAVAAQTEVVIGTSAAALASSPTPPLSRRSRLLLLSSGRNGWHRWSASRTSWARQASARGLGRSAYRRSASGDRCTGSNSDGATRRLLGPRCRHGLEEPNINLVSEERAVRIGLLSKGSEILLVDERAQRNLRLGRGIGPTLKEVEGSHPLLGGKVRACREVIGDCTYFRPKEGRYRRNGVLDVDAIPLELLDALGQELVVVNEGPEVSVNVVESGEDWQNNV